MRLGLICRGPREDASGTAATEQGADDPPPAPGLTRRPSQQPPASQQVTWCCCLHCIQYVLYGCVFSVAVVATQRLQLLLDRLCLKSLLTRVPNHCCCYTEILLGGWVSTVKFCPKLSCTHNVLGAISCQRSYSDHHIVLLISIAHQYLGLIRHMPPSTAGALAPLPAVVLQFLLCLLGGQKAFVPPWPHSHMQVMTFHACPENQHRKGISI